MTRTDNETAISNKERAELASQQNADITVRIHATSGAGMPVCVGALDYGSHFYNQYLSSDIIEKATLQKASYHQPLLPGLGNQYYIV